jgi:vacuolar-type H+-ATPase subunit H
MKYTLNKLIEEISSENPNWTDKRISWFINSVRDEKGTNYNSLTRSNRNAISILSDSELESYVGSLFGRSILDGANNSAGQIIADAQQIREEIDNTIEQRLDDANNSAGQIIADAQQIRDDAHAEGGRYLANLKAARVVELHTKHLPSESALMRMPRAGIFDYAQIIGCTVNDEMSKQEIVDTIRNDYDGLEKDVIVVPDKSGQDERVNQREIRLGFIEEASSRRESKLNDLEDELHNRQSELQSLENTMSDEENEQRRNKRLKLAQRIGYVMAGVTLAAGAVYGEYTGITDFVNFSHLRG